MWVGIALMTLAFFSLLAILSFRQVSFVCQSALSAMLLEPSVAKLFLRERISRNRWIGIAIVCLGVTIVWWTRG